MGSEPRELPMNILVNHGHLLVILFITGAMLVFSVKAQKSRIARVIVLIALMPLVLFVCTGGLAGPVAPFPWSLYLTWVVPPFLGAVVGMLIGHKPKSTLDV